MTGPEHYEAAERDLQSAAEADLGADSERYLLAKAQVHATLALAAANVVSGSAGFEIRPQAVRPHQVRREIEAWLDVAATPLRRGTEAAPGDPAT